MFVKANKKKKVLIIFLLSGFLREKQSVKKKNPDSLRFSKKSKNVSNPISFSEFNFFFVVFSFPEISRFKKKHSSSLERS